MTLGTLTLGTRGARAGRVHFIFSGLTPDSPQGMVIEITGDRQMAENLVRQIKIDLLKKQF